MSRGKELAKNTVIITIGKMGTQLISFLLLPLYTSLISAEGYGIIDLVLTYSSLLVPMATMAIEQGLFRYLVDVREDEDQKVKIISTATFFTILQTLFVVIFLLILQCIIDNKYMPFFIGVFLVSVASTFLLQLERGLGDNIGYTVGSSIAAIGQVVFNVLFLVVFRWQVAGMMIAIILGNLLTVIFIIIRAKLLGLIKLNFFNLCFLKEMLSYSIPLIPNQLSWWALNASDKVIIQFFVGLVGNGLIAVANKFSTAYTQFSIIFSISWTESAILHFKDSDNESFFSHTIETVFKLFLSFCCGIIIIMPFIFGLLINNEYNKAYNLIPIFMISALCNVVVSLYGVIYVAYKKSKEIAKTAVYAAIINILSNLLMVKFIGIYAAPISTLLGYGSMAIYRYYDSRKYIRVVFSRKTLIVGLIFLILSFLEYYCNIFAIRVILFALIGTLLILFNLDFLKKCFENINRVRPTNV